MRERAGSPPCSAPLASRGRARLGGLALPAVPPLKPRTPRPPQVTCFEQAAPHGGVLVSAKFRAALLGLDSAHAPPSSGEWSREDAAKWDEVRPAARGACLLYSLVALASARTHFLTPLEFRDWAAPFVRPPWPLNLVCQRVPLVC